MENEVKTYFYEKYNKLNIKVVPGHWPDFKSKAEVDKWIAILEKTAELFLGVEKA